MTIDSVKKMKDALCEKLKVSFGSTVEEANDAQMMRASALVLRDVMAERSVDTMRETREELGLTVDLTGQRPTLTNCSGGAFDDIYILELPVALSELHLQPEEVQNVAFATQEEIFAMIDDGRFIPYLKSFIMLLFDLHRRGGMVDCSKKK